MVKLFLKIIRDFFSPLIWYIKHVQCSPLSHTVLKDKTEINNVIVKKQPYQLMNTNHEFFPSFDASNFHKLNDESSSN